MNAARVRAELAEIITRAKRLEEALADEADVAPAPPPRFMKLGDYAKHRDVSVTTLRRWIAAGMTGVQKRGRVVRICVAEADPWQESKAIERRAAADAARGR